MNEGQNPEQILRLGIAFWKPKTLLRVVEPEVFTAWADGPQGGVSLDRVSASAQRVGSETGRYWRCRN